MKAKLLICGRTKSFLHGVDYRESHELGVIADTWTSADKQKVEKYRADIKSLESFETILSYTKVQQYILPVRVEEKKDDEGLSNKVTKKRKLRRLVKVSDAGAKSKKKKPPTVEETEKPTNILMREKKLKQEIASLQLEKGLLEHEKLTHEESRKEEQALRLAREEELPMVQAMYREAETKLTEYRESYVPKSDLHEWMTAFWSRMVPTEGLASILVGISNDAKALGSHGVAVAETASFEGDALTMLPVDAGEEVSVPELAPYFIDVQVEWEEDSSEQVEVEGKDDQGLAEEGTLTHTPIEGTNESRPSHPPGQNKIEVCTEHFIAAIDLLKKRTKEAEFYSKQAAILQNILVDHEISLPILEDLDLDDEVKETAAAEEYLLRINDQDWEILDLKDKLS
ncbi:OLC1v1008904C1 [Oldenlandia corymbosa var. corymbosa]|uniref:OLC1v1008904C1 n=1 Tax=Oldenlandia corymbosa var. corymbosa TaxID=529605 RepID=A0AAV1DP72_OLDCO|nr:OLC1v1008904C1 [Oldenlandia corymbosa var. corymbosa]